MGMGSAKEKVVPIEPEVRAEELIADDEPKYLRRQKPVEIRRRKLGRSAWRLYARVAAVTLGLVVTAWIAYEMTQFFYYSPRVVLADLDAIEVAGTKHVSPALVREKFAADRGVSVLRVPLEARRAAIEEIPWVAQARVSRALPDGIRVEVIERTPVAFLRMNTDLALLDAEGVILERPLEGSFRFPVVTGISEITAREVRRQRMQEFTQFLEEVGGVRPGAADMVSEMDLRDASDLRVTLTSLPQLGDPQASVLVHFGAGDYGHKFRVLLDNLAAWRAQVGRVDSVDLRFDNQVVVNPEQSKAAVSSPSKAGTRQ
jgi:cell division protein FtsQ